MIFLNTHSWFTAVGVDDIFDEPRQSIFLEDSIHAQVVDHVQSEAQVSYNQSQFMEQQEDCPPPPPRRESLQQSPQTRVSSTYLMSY